MLFQSEKNTVLLNIRFGKVKGLGELMRTSNAPEGEARLDAKRVGSACFPTCLRRMLSRRHI